jgi:hypothetical protein
MERGRVAWRIAADAVEVTAGYFDGAIWRWRLRDDRDAERDVYVGISAAALDARAEALPAATARAIESRGRELVEEVALLPYPPATIHVGRWSEHPSYSDEVAPAADVSSR